MASRPSVDACRGHRLWREAQHPAPAWPASAPRSQSCRPRPARTRSWPCGRTAFSSQTAPATLKRTGDYAGAGDPGHFEDRQSRSSASASDIRCWRWRSAARPRRCIKGHHGANHPVKTIPPARVEIVSMNHWFRRRRRLAAGRRRGDPCPRCSTARTAASRSPGVRCFRSSIIRRPIPPPLPAGCSHYPLPPLRQSDPRAARRGSPGRTRVIPPSSQSRNLAIISLKPDAINLRY